MLELVKDVSQALGEGKSSVSDLLSFVKGGLSRYLAPVSLTYFCTVVSMYNYSVL